MNKSLKLAINFIVGLGFVGQAQAGAPKKSVIANFHEVDGGIMRGGRPGDKGMLELAQQRGVRYVIDLENDSTAIEYELDDAGNLKIQDHPMPMSPFVDPQDGEIDQILTMMKDPAQKPMYVHCKHGRDRTGLIVGLHRVLNEGWTPQAAYGEMRKLGFRKFHALISYFVKRTGYNPEERSFEEEVSLGLAPARFDE